MDRRNFIKTTGVTAGAFAIIEPSIQAIIVCQDVGTWFNRPMRWAQLTLVENDPGSFDPDFWLGYFKKIHADATWQNVSEAHPDWIAVTVKGEKRRHWADPRLWVTCRLGPYNFEFMSKVHEEIMGKYQPDGIFSNRWAGSGICYCEHCKKNFKEYSGLDLMLAKSKKVTRIQIWNLHV
jgi:hypothetical protein